MYRIYFELCRYLFRYRKNTLLPRQRTHFFDVEATPLLSILTFLIYKFLLTDIFDAVFLLVLKIVLKKHRFENQFLQPLVLLQINQSMKF